MSIVKYTNPRELDLSPGLQDVLRRNGMQAHISANADGTFSLLVLGHDSPVLKYPISNKQVELMMNWGSNFANKTAYKTFTDIVKNDFHMPDNFVSARNVGSKVVTGLHGYRIGNGEYGYRRFGMPAYQPFHRYGRGWCGDFLGWGSRMTPGFNLRRVDGRLFYGNPSGPFVGERPDGRMKPGELRSGGYGFYYKGNVKETSQDVLDDFAIEQKLKPLEGAPRPVGQAIEYNDAINTTSEAYFAAADFKNVLSSHGLVVDEEKKTLTVMAGPTKVNCEYSLSDDEINKILCNDISKDKGVPVAERLNLINSIICIDYKDAVTMDMLNSKNLISIDFKPEVKNELEATFIKRENQIRLQEQRAEEKNNALKAARKEQERLDGIADRIERDPQAINGREISRIMEGKAFFNQARHGREMVVGEIRVDKAGDKFLMSAEINGVTVSHGISKQQYQDFLDLNDVNRLKLFDDLFKEVKIRTSNSSENERFSTEAAAIEKSKSNMTNGAALDANKGFYRDIKNGREVEVGKVWVQKQDNGYKMSAEINGQVITHDISQRQFDKFLAVDDSQRLKLFAKVFPEVDIKSSQNGEGKHVGAMILAAIVGVSEAACDIAEIAEMSRHHHGHEPVPHGGPTVYHKFGVVSPGEILEHNFNDEMSRTFGPDSGLHRGI